MRKIDDPFLAFNPYIDLHGLDRISAIIKTKEFITDSLKLKKYDIIIIHGKGSGTLKESVHEYLKTDKRVIEYKTHNFNDGITVVKLEGDSYEK